MSSQLINDADSASALALPTSAPPPVELYKPLFFVPFQRRQSILCSKRVSQAFSLGYLVLFSSGPLNDGLGLITGGTGVVRISMQHVPHAPTTV
jgi:hypothetical protein